MFVPVAFDAFNQADTGDLSKTVAARNDQDTASLVSGCWWDGEDVAPTLTKQNASGAQRMPDKANFGAVLQPISFGAQMSTPQTDVDMVQTLQAKNPMAVAIQGTVIGRSETAGPQGSGADDSGAMFTLTKTDVHAVAFGGDIARTLQARHDSSPCADRGMDVVAFTTEQTPKASSDVAFTITKGSPSGGGQPQAAMTTTMQVRRLTPVECERLQGFPDGYTNIPWRNKPESPDGPRYKALGNSMAVPCMVWIGERIQMVQNITEGSSDGA
jgi:site-specific DNA-cytosine methylase